MLKLNRNKLRARVSHVLSHKYHAHTSHIPSHKDISFRYTRRGVTYKTVPRLQYKKNNIILLKIGVREIHTKRISKTVNGITVEVDLGNEVTRISYKNINFINTPFVRSIYSSPQFEDKRFFKPLKTKYIYNSKINLYL